MTQFSHNSFWESFNELGYEDWVCEGVPIPIMALSEQLESQALEIDNYNDLLTFAADNGIQYKGERISSDEYKLSQIETYWDELHKFKNVDPCIRYRVGERVCEKSTVLKEHMESLLELESEEEQIDFIDGDDLTDDETVTLDQLQKDASLANGNAGM